MELDARAQALLDGLPDAVLLLSGDGEVVLTNRAAERLLGRGLRGRPLVEVLRNPAAHALLPDGEGEFDSTEGRRLLLHAASQSDGVLLVMRDRTRLRQLETVRRDFVANVSHELRTPVAVIKANVEILADGALREAPEPFLDAVSRNADRLQALVNDLLDLARIDEGEALQLEPTSVRRIGKRLRKEYPRLELDVPKGKRVLADAVALDQVLENLVANACRYTEGAVSLELEHEGDTLKIEVRDEGPGIEPHHRERIFERFYRVDPGRSRALGGTGLGLSIVRNLVLQMQGTVGVDVAEGRGSIFWVRLPAVDPASVPEEPEEVEEIETLLPSGRAPFEGTATMAAVRERLLLMAGRVESMIASANRAYVERNLELARQTISADHEVNDDELRVDELCLALLADSPPGARDLRAVAVTLKMVTDLERIADLAVNICQRVLALGPGDRPGPLDDIPAMAALVQEMVRTAIDAFVRDDLDAAQTVLVRDRDVDALYEHFSLGVLEAMHRDPASIEAGLHVTQIARCLERMGDHATNLGEQVVFLIVGRDIRHGSM